MSKEIVRSFAQEADEIREAYETLQSLIGSVGRKAFFIGQTLTRVKDGLPHGRFEDWVGHNLPFGPRMAQQYMAFHRRATELDSPTRAALNSAWNEMCHPARDGRELLAEEVESLRQTEGAVEPEEECSDPAGAEEKPEVRQESKAQHVALLPPKNPPGDSKNEGSVKWAISPDAPKDADGRPIPDHLKTVFEKAEDFARFAQTLSTLKGQVRQAIEADPVAWRWFNENAFRAALDKLHDLLTMSGPHIVCPYCGGDQSDKCGGCKGVGFLSKAQARCVPAEMRAKR